MEIWAFLVCKTGIIFLVTEVGFVATGHIILILEHWYSAMPLLLSYFSQFLVEARGVVWCRGLIFRRF